MINTKSVVVNWHSSLVPVCVCLHGIRGVTDSDVLFVLPEGNQLHLGPTKHPQQAELE